MNQAQHIELIAAHAPVDERESSHKSAMLSFVQKHHNFYQRSLAAGHITGSAWIVNPVLTHTLMLHHKKLDRWLQPGGHVEADAEIAATALREAQEETGITSFKTISNAIFDIDIHTIPANKNEPEHQHYDIRFLLQAELNAIPLTSDESNDVKWFPLDQVAAINDEPSILRMIKKTVKLRQ